MEKLELLLNEYHHFNSDLIGYYRDSEYEKFYFRTELPQEEKDKLEKAGALIDDGVDEQRIENERIISKRFWFIERLITTGKVDNIKLIDLVAKDDCVVSIKFEEDSQKVKVLLLMLAISDNPLDDLISVLKD